MFDLLKRRKKRPPSLKRVLSKAMHCSRRNINVGDQYLTPIDSKAMGEFLVRDKTDELEWKEGILECNTFALFFHSNAKRWFLDHGINAAIGQLWVYSGKGKVGHAFNFYLTPKLKVRYIEPQEDSELFLTQHVQFVLI